MGSGSWQEGPLQESHSERFVEKSGGALSDDAFWVKMGDPHYIEKEEEHEEEEDEDAQCVSKKEKKCVKRPKLESSLYRCPIESCSQEFLSERNLEQHLDVGRHLRRPERMNIQDISLNRYASFLEIGAPPKVCHVIDEAIGSLFDDTNAMESPLPMGWALSERKKSERFPDSVKSFLKKLHDEGKWIERKEKCPSHPEPEQDEVNDLLANDHYEGDPESEYETEPLFDVTDLMRIALTREHNNLWSKEGEKGGTEDGKGDAMEE
ncbi:hypothetical protein PRIPAC_91787 [Pristionchus pacificus]|uniref:C2H2-type domain-containing protein n=1 Tax=Pristionchus pacificus TaxID=54126 RepID=A0A2A6BAQ5_PRIPA|nr:hypothetical protein PRIPAC_91787 [Pristionchus pacificus]|eukprot:PDM62947.1 hypothetical protein PRIPAC_50162 [Pristionchus pacificus]